ncbi:MAG TPA: sigma-70 family RNA polymerase sigma factor [Jatrophihabitans sp.]|jgi:RNA polymerase sigma-70 factor (sigma-E family)
MAVTAVEGGVLERSVEDFESLWQQWRLPMVQLAVMLVDSREAAEDVVQEAFLALHRRWDRVDNHVAYLRTSVVNGCRSVLRRRLLARTRGHFLAVPEPDAVGGVLIAEEHRETMAALHRLPRRQREVLVLRYWQELSDEQIAVTLSITSSAVRSTASRARASLAALLDDSPAGSTVEGGAL